LGLFYSSAAGAIGLILAAISFGALTAGIGALVVWPISIMVGFATVSSYNAKIETEARRHEETLEAVREARPADPVQSPTAPTPEPTVTRAPPKAPVQADEVPCPLCLEAIKVGAIRCKHCKGDLSEWAAQQKAEAEAAQREADREWDTYLAGGDMEAMDPDALFQIVQSDALEQERRHGALAILQRKFPQTRYAFEAAKLIPSADPE